MSGRSAAPELTFFVELAAEPLTGLFERPEVLPFLAENGCAVSLGLLDLSPARAAVVRRLEASGVPVTAWLLLDPAHGYWLNADNPERARARWRETEAWARDEGLALHRVGLDVEPPRADAEALLRERGRALRRLLRRRRSKEALGAAEEAYRALVEEIRAGGRSVEAYHLPPLLDERAAGTALLRRTLGLVDVPVDLEVPMLYASYLGRAGARAYFPESPCIALGVTGGGVQAHDPQAQRRFLSWAHLEEDLLAAAAHARRVYVFSLEGCAERGMLEPIAHIEWSRPPPELPARERRRARLLRGVLRAALKSEPWLDRLLPALPARGSASPR